MSASTLSLHPEQEPREISSRLLGTGNWNWNWNILCTFAAETNTWLESVTVESIALLALMLFECCPLAAGFFAGKGKYRLTPRCQHRWMFNTS